MVVLGWKRRPPCGLGIRHFTPKNFTCTLQVVERSRFSKVCSEFRNEAAVSFICLLFPFVQISTVQKIFVAAVGSRVIFATEQCPHCPFYFSSRSSALLGVGAQDVAICKF